tara:strand:- start:6576 stop:7898 length:1323 start_codon:yes stop_codon:yes gene_type:complete
MSVIETAVVGSKKIERVLKEKFNAQGKGLHEYLTSVESRVPKDILKQARYVASVRNKVVHEDETIHDIAGFNQTVEDVVTGLLLVLIEEERIAAEKKRTLESRTKAKQNQPLESNDSIQQRDTTRRNVSVVLGVVASICFISMVISQQELKSTSREIKFINAEKRQTSRVLNEYKKDLEMHQNLLKQKMRVLEELKIKNKNLENKLNDTILAVEKQKRPITTAPSEMPASTKQESNSLLALAMKSGDEFKIAEAKINENLVQLILNETKVTTGKLAVSSEKNGTYSVRVPVNWSMDSKKLLQLLNLYFNGYDGKNLSLEYHRRGNSKDAIYIREINADASDSRKPYSARLYDKLQGIEILIVAALGNKKGHLTIASNVSCGGSCAYSKKPSKRWMALVKGKPSGKTISYKEENPIVIEGLSQADLESNPEPIISIIKVSR